MAVVTWVVCLLGAWFVVGTAVAVVFGRIVRARDLQEAWVEEFAAALKAPDRDRSSLVHSTSN
jgi:hypothetical protein